MKNIFKTMGLLAGLLMSGCQLDDEPIGLITQDQIDTEPTAGSVTSSVNSTYQLMANTLNIIGQWDWNGGKVLRNDFILQDIASGDMNKKWNPDGDQAWMDEVASFNFTAINAAFNGIWSYDYEGISRANMAINTLSNQESISQAGIDNATRDRLLGEVYFLRAFYYFDLLNNFGGVPLLTEPLENFAAAYDVSNRASEEEVLSLIRSDLKTAEELLPAKKYSSAGEPWRVSLGAAIALQAKVELYQENWDATINHINKLQGLNFYSLNDHYFDAFNVEKEFQENEVILAYNHEQGMNPGKGNGLAALMGWGFVAPSQDFINAFPENDPRLDYTVNVDNKEVHKLLGTTDGRFKGNADSPGNKIYIRYADVLLWKAEALIEKGNIEEGLQIIDEIRKRAQNTPSLSANSVTLELYAGKGLSQAEALEILMHERRIELGFESHRFNDLKRWGIAEEVLPAMGKNFQSHNYLYPIPQGEIDRSGGQIQQNSGY